MCNINIFLKNNNNSFSTGEIQAITGSSFTGNPDSEGAFFGKRTVKSLYKIDFTKYSEEIEKSKMIVTHQRLATHGDISEENCHPFKINNCYSLVHNGIISFAGNTDQSDSLLLADLLGLELKNKPMAKSIKAVISQHYGSYSVAIFNKNSQELLYFKNSSTQISAYRHFDGSFFLTTSNFNNLIIRNKIKKECLIDNNTLFRFSLNKGIWRLNRVDELTFKNYNYNTNSYKKPYRNDYFRNREELDFDEEEFNREVDFSLKNKKKKDKQLSLVKSKLGPGCFN